MLLLLVPIGNLRIVNQTEHEGEMIWPQNLQPGMHWQRVNYMWESEENEIWIIYLVYEFLKKLVACVYRFGEAKLKSLSKKCFFSFLFLFITKVSFPKKKKKSSKAMRCWKRTSNVSDECKNANNDNTSLSYWKNTWKYLPFTTPWEKIEFLVACTDLFGPDWKSNKKEKCWGKAAFGLPSPLTFQS